MSGAEWLVYLMFVLPEPPSAVSILSQPTPVPESSEYRTLRGVQESTLAALREALSRNGTRTPPPDGEVHRTIRQLVEEARAAGLPVEQVIILVKREWKELGIVSRARPRPETNTVVERLVTICLDEYFVDQ